MSFNGFGTIFRFSTFGEESHGKAIGCVLDGVPPNIPLSESDIQPFLDKRKPGQSKHTTQRKEADEAEILSGVFEGKTTGTPIAILIHNQDQRSKDYGDISKQFRPAHADYTYFMKYGIRDYRGGGRASARETAMRVAAGAVARKIIKHILSIDVKIRACLIQMGKQEIDFSNFDWEEVNKNPFNIPDKKAVERFEEYLNEIRKEGDSVGAKILIEAVNVPVGIGEPVYRRLDADLAQALMSINAVKAVEIGSGVDVCSMTGKENADEMACETGNLNDVTFLSNNSGGILGGISNGDIITARISVKPTPSILKPLKSVDIEGNNCEVITKGRHDPCVGIRAVPVAEAMVACVLADHILMHKSRL